jgi:NTP pyrophosphatase (non-canonical NTP hydrolase)
MREQVKWFAEQMENKLKANDHKGGWDNCNVYWLWHRIQDESGELLTAINLYRDLGADKNNIIEKAANVANFAMMIADIVRKLDY